MKKNFANQLRFDDVNTMSLVSVFIGVARRLQAFSRELKNGGLI